MTVAVQFAATATTDALPKIARAFKGLEPLLKKSRAYERSELLVNHPERKVQFLLYFTGFEEAQAFFKAHADEVIQPFRGMVQNAAGPFFLAVEGQIGK